MNFYVCTMLNILVTMRLYTVKKSVLWPMNYISLKLIFFKVHIKQTTILLKFF